MAMTSTIHRLKMFKKTPENGLAIFCGLVTTSSISMTSSAKDGAMKKMCVVMEPIVPLNRGLYYCDARFHVEDLMAQVDQHESSMTYGFVIVNGSGMLLGLLKGTSHQVLYEKGVQLPKKHSKGGQSRERFARLRDQAIDHYLKLTAEKCNEYFISKNKENLLVDGIILAGSANLKNVFSSEATKLMDYRLSSKILNVIDIQYGGMSGFMQAIDKSKALFSELRYTKEQELLNTFMNLIAIDSMKYTFGLKHTLCALEMGLVDKLILYEDLNIHRCVVGEDVAQSVQYLTPDKMTMLTEPLVHSQLLIEWLLEEDKAIMQFGCSSIELVSASSNEGQQFVKGFGAIGAILKYETNIEEMMLSSNDTHAEHFFDDDEETDDTDLDGFL